MSQDLISKEHSGQKAKDRLKIRRIFLPILLGIIVVAILMKQQFDYSEFLKISWNAKTWTFILLAVLVYGIRHAAYSYRLHILSDKFFSYVKSLQLITVWEFSTAVSPSSVGGAIVALFALSQEEYPTGKTAALVVYTVVQDSIFFIITLPILYFCIGPSIIRPELTEISRINGWVATFVFSYSLIFVYGSVLFYGLFFSPHKIQKFLHWITHFKLTRRFHDWAKDMGEGVLEASLSYRRKPFSLHFRSFLATFIAWICRFAVIAVLIVGIVNERKIGFSGIFELYSRLETMFTLVMFIPTPGGAGAVEVLFKGFLIDYVPEGIAVVIATIWRLITYYSYLLIGAIVVPPWLNSVVKRNFGT